MWLLTTRVCGSITSEHLLGVQSSPLFQQQMTPSLLSSILLWSSEKKAKKKVIMYMKTQIMPTDCKKKKKTCLSGCSSRNLEISYGVNAE